MKKIEYQLLELNDQFLQPIDADELLEQLDELGRDGWEVVAVTDRGAKWWSPRARRVLVTLKRELVGADVGPRKSNDRPAHRGKPVAVRLALGREWG